tara:strand:- start:1171 stop:1917 length:747 start_codon:yes stop_codon:yes gene_type:complete
MSLRLIDFDLLEEGILIKRYKRFLADIRLDDGRIITAHCPNTGSMKGLLSDKSRVRVSYSPSHKRKLLWTWEQVQVPTMRDESIWVGINTLMANKLIKKVISSNLLENKLGQIDSIKSEVTYGLEKKSRIDFLLKPTLSNPDNRNIYVEVKNTTWIKDNIALFPDSVTQRGQKHLKELSLVMPNSRAILIPCITRTDTDYFSTGDEVDPEYGNLFRKALKKGLIVIPCSFKFQRDNISWGGFIPLLTK